MAEEVIQLKIAICAQGKGLNAKTDRRFGRSPYFVLVDPDHETVFESIRNENADAPGGAGPQSAQLLSEHDVGAVITGNVGPKAKQALQAAGIVIYTGVQDTVGDTIKEFMKGVLKPLSGATVPGHSGIQKGRWR